ncbi:MAG TPA: tripartite tricarboxylate transporter substrate binding protein [Burkholderiales bacterium]|nr:tripartite tricarboxylate transporter substrate binding protein [Burkholderiales bacterium]
MRREVAVSVLIAAAAAAAAPASAAPAGAYPERPIRLVVGFPPGGATDIFARILSQYMPESIGQTVVVDNRGGASGTIAAAMVAKAPADGYTLMMVPSGPYTIGASTYHNLPYDAVNDFQGVSQLTWVTNVIVVPQASPVKSLQDLIRMAKEKPGTVTFCSSGSGSLHHLSGEILKRLTSTDMTHVPFKGAGPALTALAGNEVTFGFTSMPSAVPLINAKRLRPIAVTSLKRLSALPSTPTMTEAGVPPPPGLDIREWYGVLAPAATPKPIIDKLNAEMIKVFKRPDVQTRLTEMGAEYVGSTPQALQKQLANDVKGFAKWVKDAGIRAD